MSELNLPVIRRAAVAGPKTRTALVRGLVAAIALLASINGHADPNLPAPKPQSIAPAWAQASLLAAAGDARFEIAANPATFLATADPTSRATFGVVLDNGGNARGAEKWRALFAGALQVRHQHEDDGETLWFNPVFDTGLLVRWHREQYTWVAVSTRWVTGTEIRGDAPGTWVPLPIQAIDVRRFNANFSAVAAKTLARSAVADWPAPASAPSNNAVVRGRLAAAQDALAKMQSTRGYQTSLSNAQHLLTHSGIAGPRPAPSLARILDGLGTRTCETLRPVSAYRRGSEGWTLVLQTSMAPGIAVLVDFLDSRRGPAEIKTVSVRTYIHTERHS